MLYTVFMESFITPELLFRIQLYVSLGIGSVVFILLSILLFKISVFLFKIGKREEIALDTVALLIRMPKDNEIKIDAAEQFFSSLYSIKKGKKWMSFLDLEETLGFEIVAKEGDISFYIHVPVRLKDLLEKQLYASYPNADITVVDEPNIFTENGHVAFDAMVHKETAYYPPKTYKDMPNDSIASIASAMSKLSEGEGALLQILIQPAD